jgi:hypothetical protein
MTYGAVPGRGSQLAARTEVAAEGVHHPVRRVLEPEHRVARLFDGREVHLAAGLDREARGGGQAVGPARLRRQRERCGGSDGAAQQLAERRLSHRLLGSNDSQSVHRELALVPACSLGSRVRWRRAEPQDGVLRDAVAGVGQILPRDRDRDAIA